ncbi:MAG: hypothetical protein KatS3mg096_629 [Candidatus Parcubacteria bacterium]|nr:MAG: hypothetical protein KatS3mg096_629 [Candidatus Parcubacteria bacterium]
MPYSKDYEKIIEHVFKYEGEINDSNLDSGNFCTIDGVNYKFLTKYGITCNFVRDKLKYTNPTKIKQFIQNLTKDDAKKLYYDYIYNHKNNKLDNIKNRSIKQLIFDMMVKSGESQARQDLKNAVAEIKGKKITDYPSIPHEYMPILSEEINKMNKEKQEQLFNKLKSRWTAYESDKNKKFLQGILNRINSHIFVPYEDIKPSGVNNNTDDDPNIDKEKILFVFLIVITSAVFLTLIIYLFRRM